MAFRDSIRKLSPAFLQEGVGERLMYVFGLELDAVMERLHQGIKARFPLVTGLQSKVITPGKADALALIGADRLIDRGLSESDLSYAVRLQRAIDTWRLAGTARAVLGQVLGYLLAFTPRVRMVSSRYAADPARVAWYFARGLIPSVVAASYPPARLSSQWETYEAGADPKAEPDNVLVTASGGNWDWDSLSQVDGSWGWWGAWIIIYATSPQDWAHEPTWELDPASPYTLGTAPGSLGLDVSSDVIESIRGILRTFKSGNVWIRQIIVSFDDALFDPEEPAGGGVNPDGYFGLASRIVSGEYVPSRFADAAYCDGVV